MAEPRGFWGSAELVDAHCHLGWFADPAAAARELAGQGAAVLCVTVEPAEYERLLPVLAHEPNVRLAAGLHPWWVARGLVGEADVERACELARASAYVGEVGLDFGKRLPAASLPAQLDAFERICRAAAGASGQGRAKKTLSIHSSRAAGEALDTLERTGALEACDCVLHWFSGTGDELRRAIDAGCLFSIGERMLATRRGREYARQVPPAQTLLETDLPPEPDWQCPAAEVARSLAFARGAIGQIRSRSGGGGRSRV